MSRQLADRIGDLEERVRVLEAENAALKKQLLDLTEGETITLDLGSIPDYLKHGEYYANLIGVGGAIVDGEPGSTGSTICSYNRDNVDVDVDSDKANKGTGNMISVPKKCFKADTEIRPNVDLVLLLETLRYWMVDTLPDSVIWYALNTFESFKSVAEEFWADMPTLKVLSTVAEKGSNGGINEQIICAFDEGAPHEIMYYLFVHHDTDSKLRQEVVIRAAKLGSLEYLEYILSRGRCDILGCNICREAAESGHLDCLMYAYEQGCPWNSFTCSRAAKGGHLDCMKYAYEHGCPWDEWAFFKAAEGGHLDCMKYAHEHGCPFHVNTCEVVAEGGYLECLKYAHEHGCPWDERTCAEASLRGYLDILMYAYEQGCPWDEDTCENAASCGFLDCLMYAHERGCPWKQNTCSSAAGGGYLDCLKYAHENGCPWDETTCSSAAGGGHLDCMKYSYEQGCPWDKWACYKAAEGGYWYCFRQGYSWNRSCFSKPDEGGYLDCWNFAHEPGCRWIT